MKRILSIVAVVSVLSIAFAAGSHATPMARKGFSTYGATKLVGLTVKSRDGVPLGQILNLVADSNGRLDFAIVDQLVPSDWTDLWPGHTVAVPIRALTISKGGSEEPQVVLNTDKEKFYEAPEAPTRFFDSVARVNPQKVARLDKAFGVRAASMARKELSTYDTTKLVWHTVKSRHGVQLGQILDLVADSNGHLDFAIVSQPGIDELGGRLAVVPFSMLRISKAAPHKMSVVFNADKEKFYEGPDWDYVHLSDMKQAASVDRYYGIHPYWTKRTGKAGSPTSHE